MPFSKSILQEFMHSLSENAHILDICSGTDSIKVIRELITSGFRVTAVDFSEKTVQTCQPCADRV